MHFEEVKNAVIGLTVMIFFVASAFYYIINIVQLVQEHYTTGMVTIKVIGVFVAPLGVVMGIVG